MKLEKDKSVNVSTTLPQSIVQDIDRLAAESGVSRAYVMKVAIMTYLDSLNEEDPTPMD
jgi:metal-responsive CopG/Arc/MetJ family transcriptional regulator